MMATRMTASITNLLILNQFLRKAAPGNAESDILREKLDFE